MQRNLLHCFAFFLAAISLVGNNPVRSGFTFGNDVFGTRVFVENKGQFDSKPSKGKKILYALDNGNEKIYFTISGLIYEHVKPLKLDESEEEERERESEGKNQPSPESEPTYKYVYMNWDSSNSSSSYILPSEKQSNYFNFGTDDLNLNTFKKIT